ncbi:MAG: 16S rRNA (guanine(527)-N(7))-methyltransferase RsmG [Nitrospirae bacterium]|nr:16S rRNA (guanine(527)-N(7))-methyltransferase RsmG [Nitrospirota bacterium]
MSTPASASETLLMKGFKELCLDYTTGQVAAFMTYLSELKKWNRAYSLTSLKTDEEIVIKHFLDSLLYLKGFPDGAASVLDVGSGAGFPGIPIKIMRPEIYVYLLEPSGKKANFLVHLVKSLGLGNVEVLQKRVEELKSAEVDVAVTRALFAIKEFFRKVSPCVKRGGRLILSKGPKVEEELKAIEGMDFAVLNLPLPLSPIKRFLVVIRKDMSRPVSEGQPLRRSADTFPDAPGTCVNAECRLRRAGCRGFEGCPGFKARG